jgi:spermidine synthase
MNSSHEQAAVSPSIPPPYFALLLLLFVGSGCAALIYEIVWFELLQLIVGSSAVSMGVLLGTFMGGMCLGSLYLARVISARKHPLLVYAALEAGIGIFGILILAGLPYVGGLYTAIGGPGAVGVFVRAVICAICLLPPTLLMGATLPAIARWVEATPHGMSWLGFFYGGNTLGAVVGCLVAGFYLLRAYDMSVTTYVAVAINATVALAGFALSKLTPYKSIEERPEISADTAAPNAWPVLLAIMLSGMTALGAEVVWTRLLSLTLGATVYTFSLVLAAFLIGLGIGSGVGSLIARSVANPREALGWCQVLLMGAMAWAAYSLADALPYWPINPGLATLPAYTFQIDFIRCLWAVLPAACLWGASFPLALAGVALQRQDPGRLVGRVYAANTVGAIVGALTASLLLIAWVGTQQSQRILIVLAGIAAALMLAPVGTTTGKLKFDAESLLRTVVMIALAVWLAWNVHAIPGLLVAYGRNMANRLNDHGELIFVAEGINSSMAVSRLSNGILNYHNAGKVQASSDPADMRLQRMLGHLTTLVPKQTRSVLVIGCGAGVTAGAVSIDPAVEREIIAEIEPLVPRVVSTYFSEHNFDVVHNPKVHIQIDDARHYLITTKEKFDAVTSDPFDPWVKGAATLYTKEFFELVKQHLNPGGVVTVFVQFYESNEAAVKSEIATFFEAFPNGVVLANTIQGMGYDVVLLGQVEPLKIDIDEIGERLNRPEYAPVAQSLREIGFNSPVDLFSTYAGRRSQLDRWLRDAQVNRDRNLRLQYLAGLGLNLYTQDAIYRSMVAYREYPEDIFTGSPERLQALRSAMLGETP